MYKSYLGVAQVGPFFIKDLKKIIPVKKTNVNVNINV